MTLGQYLLGNSSKKNINARAMMRLLNGAGGVESRRIINHLAILTLNADLKYLAALAFYSSVFSYSLVRSTAAWCPGCFDHWHIENQILYEPLLWYVEAVKICTKHLVYLEDRCPECERPQNLFSGSAIAHCQHCSSWLGGIHFSHDFDPETDLEFQYHIWATKVVSEMLLAPFKVAPWELEAAVKELPITIWLCYKGADRIYAWKRKFLRGSPREWELRTWKNKWKEPQWESALPQLEGILKACFLLEISPFRILYWDCQQRRLRTEFGYEDPWFVETRAPTWQLQLDWPPKAEIPQGYSGRY